MTETIYCPIRKDQVRLMKFVRNEQQKITAILISFSVENLPKFQALSYVWASETGEIAKNWSIHIGESALPVLDTLRPFVQALVRRGKLLDGSWWWIDYICINQLDTGERDEQVQLMQYVYARADHVIAWLGEESEESDLALDFIGLLDDRMQQPFKLDELRSTLQGDQYGRYWKALEDFLSRRWWSRNWTVQEFVIPPRLSFWCGMRDITRLAVCRSLTAVDRCTSTGFKDKPAFRYAYNRKRALDLYGEASKRRQNAVASLSLPLLSLASYFSCMDAGDDRDRLYGLTALATDGNLLRVDYDASTEEVYIRFAQAFIDNHKSLDVICFASGHSALTPTKPGQKKLPSWVPDWRREASLSVSFMVSQSSSVHIGNMRPARFRDKEASVRYTASGDKAAIYKFQDWSLLTRGVILDTVDGLVGSEDSGMVQSSSDWNLNIQQQSGHCYDDPGCHRSSISILETICRSLVLDRHDRFLRYPMPASRDVPKELAQWYCCAKTLQICGQTFEEILDESLQSLECHGHGSGGFVPNLDEFVQDSFIGRFFDTVVRMSLRLMISYNGRIGMVPEKAMKGDLVCILYGCSVPVILRDMAGDDGFSVVGECFLDGGMDGSILKETGFLEKTFLIN
ncbi:hypothetical protein PG985_015744 [Apiospora marii]|uniref:uncharacterized protein n=1 Tax=Apiospora marii TaxID=335849 RepID=UPI00312DA203